MEHTSNTVDQWQPTQRRRWAFLRRLRSKVEAAPHGPQASTAETVPPSRARRLARHVLGMVRTEAAPVVEPRAAAEVETPELPVTINRARKWGRRVLNFVSFTEHKVEAAPPGPQRSENKQVLGEARADMQAAQQDLDTAASEPAPRSVVDAPDFMRKLKHEAKRTAKALRAERQKLKNAQPASETANAVTLGILAMIGGGIFMSMVDQRGRATRKKIEKQEVTIAKQEVKIEKLEQQLEVATQPSRELVRRIGEFTHKQAALTRDIAQEVRELRGQPERQFAEPRAPERHATFVVPELHTSPEVAQATPKATANSPSATAVGAAASADYQPGVPVQPTQTPAARIKKPQNKKKPQDPVAGYIAVALATVAALVLWFVLGG